jgi:hypothetical protein
MSNTLREIEIEREREREDVDDGEATLTRVAGGG